MNFSTNEFNEKAYAEVNNSYGSFNTRKHTVKAGTGLINNHFTVDARLSRIESDGFIDRAATNLESFFLSGAYVSKKTSVRLNIISGKEKTYQAWNGIPEAKLRNQPDKLLDHYYNNIGSLYFTPKDSVNLFTADPRRFNVYLYDNQTDNYRQDHYQFFVNHEFSEALKGNVTLFYSQGAGYYEQFRYNNRFSSYGLPDVTVGSNTVRRTDLIRQLGGMKVASRINQIETHHYLELLPMELVLPPATRISSAERVAPREGCTSCAGPQAQPPPATPRQF